MRIALGIVSGENEVTVVLTGPAIHLLDGDTDDLVDGDDIAKFRAALGGVAFHVEARRRPTDWNSEGHTVVRVTPAEVAELVRGSRARARLLMARVPPPAQGRPRGRRARRAR